MTIDKDLDLHPVAGAIGGGAELSVACDYCVVSEKSQGIGFVHAKMHLIPAWGGTKRLVQKIGYRSALDILSKARIMSPSECIRLGLADEVSPITHLKHTSF